jgi:MazG family protein
MNSIDELRKIVARLRGPGGCPWDQEQTHQSIRPQLLEECYEVLEAIDEQNDPLLREELGDVLLHIVFHAQLAEERGAFTLNDVTCGINDKLVRRHPHVFGAGDKLGSAAEVLTQWDEIKKAEKPERTGALHGIPPILPALMLAQETQKKAAEVGFDWGEIQPVLDKVKEEIAELENVLNHPSQAADELGDVFFSLVNLARHLHVDAEQACRDSTRKFSQRFEAVEKKATATGRPLREMTLEEMDVLWEEAKKDGTI